MEQLDKDETSAMEREQELYRQDANNSAFELVPDNAQRACWVCSNGSIYVEVRAPFYRQATEFLIAIAEPQSRPEFVHHYKLTAYSLYAGSSSAAGLDTTEILRTLTRHSKNLIPTSVQEFIQFFTQSYGRVRLVLRRNRVFVESDDDQILRELLTNEAIRTARIVSDSNAPDHQLDNGPSHPPNKLRRRMATDVKDAKKAQMKAALATTEGGAGDEDADNDDDEEEDGGNENEDNADDEDGTTTTTKKKKSALTVSFEIDGKKIPEVKRAASNMYCPLLEEYDYARDDINPNLEMQLKGNVKTREYQDKALSKMFADSRARSGVIVLPCGAGKTLTGISAACTIHKSTIVLCPNNQSVQQWIAQFHFFTNVSRESIVGWTSTTPAVLPSDGRAIVLLTTYSMMSIADERRSAESREAMGKIKKREWGFLILDEVHMAPSDKFRKALYEVKTHCKLGLSATLVREDNQIGDLNYLVGPKLYEADWMDLTNKGYLARVMCAEVWCPMSSLFMRAYLDEQDARRREFLYVMNPNKFAVCKQIMKDYESQGDKILIFSDNVAAVEAYGRMLGVYYMHGKTSDEERFELLKRFRLPNSHPNSISTLVISKIGDVAIDLPDANVLIQVASHFGSRRQEAQRLGRILRPKNGVPFGKYNAFFFTLVSQDTSEMFYSNNRRQYLIDQGYAFKVILYSKMNPVAFGDRDAHTEEEQKDFLKVVTLEASHELENLPED